MFACGSCTHHSVGEPSGVHGFLGHCAATEWPSRFLSGLEGEITVAALLSCRWGNNVLVLTFTCFFIFFLFRDQK